MKISNEIIPIQFQLGITEGFYNGIVHTVQRQYFETAANSAPLAARFGVSRD